MTKYPEKIESSRSEIYAVLEGEIYTVHFPYSPEAVKLAKSVLKAPKFDGKRKVWTVKRRWHKALQEGLDALAHLAEEAEDGKRRAKEERAAKARAAAAAGRAAIEAMEPYKTGISVTVMSGGIRVSTAYHGEIVKLFRSLDGKFEEVDRSWTMPMAAGVEIARNRDKIRDWHNETVEQDRARDEERAAARAARILVLVEQAPRIGETIRRGGGWVTVTSLGKRFRADEDTSSMGGPIGAEGQWVCYAYFRDATEEEISEAEKADAERAAAAARARTRMEAIETIRRGEYAPETGGEPAGHVLWKDETHAPTGYRVWVLLGEDGYLYHMTYDGSDGAAWGDYNAGYNTRAYRVKATDELVGALR